ncbi:MAG TPA: hypothetical protein VGT08_08875 [Terracidiphilus sp.]|nr:hypothetical protein [Terracidiphilus sp.]
MKKWIALVALLLPLSLAGCSHKTVVVYAAPPPPPPPALDETAQRAYHDGFEAARRDVSEERRPGVEKHPRFRNPPVPPPEYEDYRHGFRAGYNAFLHQGPHGPAPEGSYPQAPPPPPPQ